MSQRILLLNPWGMSYMDEPALELVARHVRPDTTVEVRNLGEAAPPLPWPVEDLEATMVAEAQRAQAEGFDGLVIACSGDPYLKVVREAVDIPVSAPTEAAIHLSRSFGKVAVLARRMPDSYSAPLSRLSGRGNGDFWEDKAREYGLADDEFTIRRVPITRHPEFESLEHLTDVDPDGLRDMTLDAMTAALLTEGVAQAKAAVQEDGAEVIYFACTFWSRGLDELSGNRSLFGVPVLNPLVSAAIFVESAIIARGHTVPTTALSS
ncbi:hypothetical protein StoSoilA2_19810 [Arthrobacter sp. StoSoilA2]|uniref:aspartate/glutamate racemase family protein n=1 Tax=Arthrobacter sp. StoSoilA2 TaxID=2830990 RepID=UPI001CC4976E|nr:aspartate/glutamate racemase family protein [Arthrobacter sp. StoSoilA2]BCW35925.1 hypothetical protein StoSoilA2_19810 [Arthrobacter sp. StoSoilA2]